MKYFLSLIIFNEDLVSNLEIVVLSKFQIGQFISKKHCTHRLWDRYHNRVNECKLRQSVKEWGDHGFCPDTRNPITGISWMQPDELRWKA